MATPISEEFKVSFRRVLLDTYFAGVDPAYRATTAFEADVHAHLEAR